MAGHPGLETPNLGQNRLFLPPVTLKFDGWPWKNNRTPLLCYFKNEKLCASFHSHQSIQTQVTVQKRPIWVKIGYFGPMWPWNFTDDLGKTIGHLFYATSSFGHHFIAISKFKLKLQSGNLQFGSKMVNFFVPCDLEIWQMTSRNNRASLLCHYKLRAAFHSHLWIQTGVTLQKCPNWEKKKLTSMTFDLWPWLFAWRSLLPMIITPENFMMIWWKEHCEKGVKDGWRTEVFLKLLGRS